MDYLREGQILDDPFALPTLGSAKEKDVNNFVFTQHLSVVEIRGQSRNLLRVDANDVHEMSPDSHVNRLPRLTFQASLDTLWDFCGEQNRNHLLDSGIDNGCPQSLKV